MYAGKFLGSEAIYAPFSLSDLLVEGSMNESNVRLYLSQFDILLDGTRDLFVPTCPIKAYLTTYHHCMSHYCLLVGCPSLSHERMFRHVAWLFTIFHGRMPPISYGCTSHCVLRLHFQFLLWLSLLICLMGNCFALFLGRASSHVSYMHISFHFVDSHPFMFHCCIFLHALILSHECLTLSKRWVSHQI